jgi:hypothetical protein
MSKENQVVLNAEAAMKENRLSDSIALFERHLEHHPNDLKSLLHLGICRLLNRQREMFLQIFDEAVKLKNRLRAIPDDPARVFAQYEGLVKKVTATALVLTVGAVSGCHDVYTGPVYEQLSTEDTDAVADGGDTDTDQ